MGAALIIFGILAVAIALVAVGVVFGIGGTPSYSTGGPYTVIYSSNDGFTLSSQTGDSKSGTVTFNITSLAPVGPTLNFAINPTTLPYPSGLGSHVTVTGPATVTKSVISNSAVYNKNLLYVDFTVSGTGTAVFTFSI